MKRKSIWLGLIFFYVQLVGFAQVTELQSQLENIPGVVSVQKIDNNDFFNETYEIMVEQYLDHQHPEAGKFAQRVILSDYNRYSPIIFVTEGYTANYATKPTYINELSKIIEANQLVVEYRYFGKSVPENVGWEYLTIKNACDDLHYIQQLFERIYNHQNKWIATGISKGGENTIAYKAFYPDDMDVWIPYVGPVNFAVEDKRMQKYIEKDGTPKCRKKVEDFQLAVLKHRNEIQPLFDSLTTAEGYTFSVSNEEVLDYCVLEYSFSFWQWGNSCATIPSDTVSSRVLFDHLVSISNPDYFAIDEVKPIKPFFIQAAKEFGYYSYNAKPLQPYLKIETAKGYLQKLFLSGEPTFKFDKKTSKFINKSIQKDGDHMILIYGEYDPWTAGGIVPKSKSKAVRFVKPQGSHRTRINNMSYTQRAEIYKLLEKYLGMANSLQDSN